VVVGHQHPEALALASRLSMLAMPLSTVTRNIGTVALTRFNRPSGRSHPPRGQAPGSRSFSNFRSLPQRHGAGFVALSKP
jgi:hypothetical protein